MAEVIAAPGRRDGEGVAAVIKSKKLLSDLPMELQRAILRHSSASDLIAMALVSRHFHSLACAQLYRIFSIVFPDDDDPAFDSPIDGLAGGLDTMVTSPQDYARFLREISLDSLSGGTRGEKSYKYYSYAESCGKFMNTLLVLTMRRAKALETFRWNIRVELGRPLYQALHQINTLKHLHIRLQAGPSLYMSPPPLPSLSKPPSPDPKPPTTAQLMFWPDLHISPAIYPPKPHKLPSPDPREKRREPLTLAGFKELQSLSVLDMDSLDYLPELTTCIRNSSSTLKKLKLSLSEALAMRARKPVLDESDESEEEIDEFGQTIGQPANNPIPAPHPEGSLEKEAKIRAERSNQEAILARIFDLEKPVPEKKKEQTEEELKEAEKAKETAMTEKARKALEAQLTAAAVVYFRSTRTPQAELAASLLSTDIVGRIGQAISSLPSAGGAQSVTGIGAAAVGPSSGTVSSGVAATEVAAPPVHDTELGTNKTASTPHGGDGNHHETVLEPGPSAFASKSNTNEPNGVVEKVDLDIQKDSEEVSTMADDVLNKSTSKPSQASKSLNKILDDIDLEHPDLTDNDDADGEEIESEPAAVIDSKSDENEDSAKVLSNQRHEDTIQQDVQSPAEVASEGTGISANISKATMSGGLDSIPVTSDAVKGGEGLTSRMEALKEYVRSTRKLPLDTLSLYLVPVKASILSRAIDLTALRRITLLNVGPQAPFWTSMSILNRTTPLKLEYIHTDNVTPKFLSLVSSLHQLKEIYLLERNSQAKVESLSGKTTVGIEELRKHVLKPHLKTLEKIMIRNDDGYAWDVDGKAMKLITKRGRKLVELAVSMGLRSFHLLLQYLPGVASLRALHIISFHTEDTCLWVMRELRKFAIDSVAHHPQMKLEYIGLDHTVERLLRKPKGAKKSKADKRKDKAKASSPVSETPNVNGVAPTTVQSLTNGETQKSPHPCEAMTNGSAPHASNGEIDDDSSSSDEGGDEDLQPLLKIETLENVRMYDVDGVRIFRKDVMAGRL